MTDRYRSFKEKNHRGNRGLMVSRRKLRMFLKALEQSGKPNEAAELAGFKGTGYLRNRKSKDKDFSDAWDAAVMAAYDKLEDEAVRRARDGVDKGVYYKGEEVAKEKQYSDTLMVKLLEAGNPEKFREKKQDTTTNINVGIAVLPATIQDVDDWEKTVEVVHDKQKKLSSKSVDEIIDVEVKEVKEKPKLKLERE